MSYILDALKKSEQARGNCKTRGLLEEPVKVAVIPSSQPPKSSPRWLYIVVFTLLLNAGFFAFRLRSWQWGGNANISSSRISGGQIVENKIPPKDQEAMQTLKTEPARADQARPNPRPRPRAYPEKMRLPSKSPMAPNCLRTQELPEQKRSSRPQIWKRPRRIRPHALSRLSGRQPAVGSFQISSLLPSWVHPRANQPACQEPKWHELAPQIRDALPNLSVSMLIYSQETRGQMDKHKWIQKTGR